MEIKKRFYIRRVDTNKYLCIDPTDTSNIVHWVDVFSIASCWEDEEYLWVDLKILHKSLINIPFEIVEINTIIHP